MRHRRTDSNNPPHAGRSQGQPESGKVRTMICGLQSFCHWVLQDSHQVCNLGSIPPSSQSSKHHRALEGSSREACHAPGSECWCAAPGSQHARRFCHILHKQRVGSHCETFARGPPGHGEWRTPEKQNAIDFIYLFIYFLGGSFVFTSVYSSFSLFDSSFPQAV